MDVLLLAQLVDHNVLIYVHQSCWPLEDGTRGLMKDGMRSVVNCTM
jgi:hypothetical protein